MFSNSLSVSIDKVIQECVVCGSGCVKVDDVVSLSSEWEALDESPMIDVVTVYILENDIIKLRFQVEDIG